MDTQKKLSNLREKILADMSDDCESIVWILDNKEIRNTTKQLAEFRKKVLDVFLTLEW